MLVSGTVEESLEVLATGSCGTRHWERGSISNEFVEDPGFLQFGQWSSKIWPHDMTYKKRLCILYHYTAISVFVSTN